MVKCILYLTFTFDKNLMQYKSNGAIINAGNVRTVNAYFASAKFEG